jgi:hypothetical protein
MMRGEMIVMVKCGVEEALAVLRAPATVTVKSLLP